MNTYYDWNDKLSLTNNKIIFNKNVYVNNIQNQNP